MAEAVDSGNSLVLGTLGWFHYADRDRESQWDHDDLALPPSDEC